MAQETPQQKTPQLAPPGAGIPFPQKLVLQLYVRTFFAYKTQSEVSKKRFEKINKKIIQEIEVLN